MKRIPSTVRSSSPHRAADFVCLEAERPAAANVKYNFAIIPLLPPPISFYNAPQVSNIN